MCDGIGLALAHYVVALPSLHYHNELADTLPNIMGRALDHSIAHK